MNTVFFIYKSVFNSYGKNNNPGSEQVNEGLSEDDALRI